ncbi:MAG: phenylalanine--tRNA ligase subunit alpha [Candidatus Paracaedibacteraceae bacterium]|nr:phenylalanine--tRNA ligase subunit alpha [Candidatus Paracaedibacteraceae bacterium]
MIDVEILEQEALEAIQSADTLNAIEAVRIDIMGKNGKLTAAMKNLANLSVEEKKAEGQKLNTFRDRFNTQLQVKKNQLEAIELEAQLKKEFIDVTLPVSAQAAGRIHPLTKVIEEATDIFAQMGFSVAEGPDIETDHYNFSILNILENHPARQMHDTFYLKQRGADDVPLLLRTHTSPVQVRTMLSQELPIRIIAPGKTYRCDSDQTHTPMFHQIEGLYVDRAENVHMGHLKSCIETFCRAFFEMSELPIRFRPSFFPFTEPSAEVDIGCSRSKEGVHIGGGSDWLEILGCGMVHPNVLRNCGIDPEEYQGFAFGMGIERLAMLKYNIPDLRTFFEGHLQWIKHYGFLPFSVNCNANEDA